MGFREKIGYIIEYYGFMILALILMIIVGISVVSGLFEEEKDAGMSIAAVNQHYTDDDMGLWEEAFKDAYEGLPVEFDSSYQVDFDGFADDTKQGYLMKLSANLFAGEIDMMILDERSYEHFAGLGALRDLGPLIEEVLSGDEMDESGRKLLTQAEAEKDNKTFGLMLPEEFNLGSSGNTYLVIPGTSSGEYGYPELIRVIYAF